MNGQPDAHVYFGHLMKLWASPASKPYNYDMNQTSPIVWRTLSIYSELYYLPYLKQLQSIYVPLCIYTTSVPTIIKKKQTNKIYKNYSGEKREQQSLKTFFRSFDIMSFIGISILVLDWYVCVECLECRSVE